MMNLDMGYTLILVGIVALLVVAYGIRVIVKGRAHFSRVDRQGGSSLLSKSVMEMAYWWMHPLARLLVFCRVTPNQITWTSLVFALLAGACLAFGHFGFGAIFATISAFMDSLDGWVARETGVSSGAGAILDASVDRYNEFIFLAGLMIYYREIPLLLIIALFALLGSFMVSYSSAKAEAHRVDPPKGSMRRPERSLYLIAGAAFSPLTIPWLETYREFSIPIGHPMVMALCLVAVAANVSAIERLWAIAKAIRVREQNLQAAERQAAEPASAADHPIKA